MFSSLCYLFMLYLLGTYWRVCCSVAGRCLRSLQMKDIGPCQWDRKSLVHNSFSRNPSRVPRKLKDGKENCMGKRNITKLRVKPNNQKTVNIEKRKTIQVVTGLLVWPQSYSGIYFRENRNPGHVEVISKWNTTQLGFINSWSCHTTSTPWNKFNTVGLIYLCFNIIEYYRKLLLKAQNVRMNTSTDRFY